MFGSGFVAIDKLWLNRHSRRKNSTLDIAVPTLLLKRALFYITASIPGILFCYWHNIFGFAEWPMKLIRNSHVKKRYLKMD